MRVDAALVNVSANSEIMCNDVSKDASAPFLQFLQLNDQDELSDEKSLDLDNIMVDNGLFAESEEQISMLLSQLSVESNIKKTSIDTHIEHAYTIDEDTDADTISLLPNIAIEDKCPEQDKRLNHLEDAAHTEDLALSLSGYGLPVANYNNDTLDKKFEEDIIEPTMLHLHSLSSAAQTKVNTLQDDAGYIKNNQHLTSDADETSLLEKISHKKNDMHIEKLPKKDDLLNDIPIVNNSMFAQQLSDVSDQSMSLTDMTVQEVPLHEISQTLMQNVQAGSNRIVMHINPPDLGSLSVRIQVADGSVSIQMRAESEQFQKQVVNHLTQHMTHIKNNLQDHGLNLKSLHVDTDNANQNMLDKNNYQDNQEPQNKFFKEEVVLDNKIKKSSAASRIIVPADNNLNVVV